MPPIKIRNTLLGEGLPKICVPIVGTTEKEILEEAGSFSGLPLDMVEWRADWFEEVTDTEAVLSVLEKLREALGETALLFTFRTAKEGGKRSIRREDYAALNLAVAASGNADLIDVEAFWESDGTRMDGASIAEGDVSGSGFAENLIREIHACGGLVVASNHDFDKTPDRGEMLRRLRRMQEIGGDVPKLAVMPRTKSDVLELLAATEEMAGTYADRPIITMSMSGIGAVSRICGEIFGSALTFGAAKKASAPGQLAVEELDAMLDVIHRSL